MLHHILLGWRNHGKWMWDDTEDGFNVECWCYFSHGLFHFKMGNELEKQAFSKVLAHNFPGELRKLHWNITHNAFWNPDHSYWGTLRNKRKIIVGKCDENWTRDKSRFIWEGGAVTDINGVGYGSVYGPVEDPWEQSFKHLDYIKGKAFPWPNERL
jgi:hypothetical protein